MIDAYHRKLEIQAARQISGELIACFAEPPFDSAPGIAAVLSNLYTEEAALAVARRARTRRTFR
jgi:hypothetical protein